MSTRSKKLLIEILLFSILLFTLIQLSKSTLSYLVRHSDNAQTGKVNLIMNHAIDPEIIFFGSSVAEVGFNSNKISEIVGHTVYNAALDGTRITQSKYLIEEFNQYAKHCKVVILAVSFFTLTDEEKLTEPTRFYAHFDNERINKMFYESDKNTFYKVKYLPFYAFTQYKHTYYKNAAIGGMNLFNNKKLHPDPNNGFVPHYAGWYGEEIDSVAFGSEEIMIGEQSINSIYELIGYLKNKNREVILVISPLYIKGQLLYKNFDELKKKVRGFKQAGVSVIDLSTLPLNHEKTFFYNNGHLNAEGAEWASEILADSLRAVL